MILNPFRVFKIVELYSHLKGIYRFRIILAHIYKESFYKKRQVEKNNLSRENFYENQQVIINIHDGLTHSGGLTDRLKGICTLYMFSKKENFKFKIHFVHPFSLEKYLLPNIYDWTMNEKAISYDLKSTAIYTWENEKSARKFFQENADKQQLHISCNSWECIPYYSDLFNELFKPSPLLNTDLEFHTKKLGGIGKYISISLRFQNLLGEFKEGNSKALDEVQHKILVNKCLTAINDIREKYIDIENFLITSDSNIFREIVNKRCNYTYTYILPEEIGHIDYADVGRGKELTAFLDMFLIARASKAFQVRSAEMYNSDFPNMAAKINNVPYEMVLID
jgi:hypothetical protein